MSATRVQILFTGTVQGVGFRWRTRRIAARCEVFGSVENLPDGRVRLLLQGAPAAVNSCIAEVEERMAAHIRSVERCQLDPDPTLTDFRIRG